MSQKIMGVFWTYCWYVHQVWQPSWLNSRLYTRYGQFWTQNLKLAKLRHFVLYAIICVCSRLLVYIMNICIYYGIYTYKYIVFIYIYVYFWSYAHISDCMFKFCIKLRRWIHSYTPNKVTLHTSWSWNTVFHINKSVSEKIMGVFWTYCWWVHQVWQHSWLNSRLYTRYGNFRHET